MAIESAAMVWTRRALPCSHRLSGGQSRMQAATAAGSGRRLRSWTRFLVQGIDAISHAVIVSTEAEATADAGRSAVGVQTDCPGALTSRDKAGAYPNGIVFQRTGSTRIRTLEKQ